MSTVAILTNCQDFRSILIRQEALPHGVAMSDEPAFNGDGAYRFALRMNKRIISPLAFSLWILRRLRSLPGGHRLEIAGRDIPMDGPEAIDLVMTALIGGSTTPEIREAA